MKPRLQLKPKNKVRVSAKIRLAYVGAAFAVVVACAFLVYYNFGTSEDSLAGEQAGLTGFSHRNKIFISKDLIRGNDTLFNFPILMTLKNEELKHISAGGLVINKKGFDIRVTKNDGYSILSTQIDSYSPESGLLKIWVLLDTLCGSHENDLMLYYGNPTIQTELPPLVWSNNYQAVWHFNGDAKAANTRKINTSQSGILKAKGKFADAFEFDAARKDYISVDYQKSLDLTSDFTISAWIFLKDSDRKQTILGNHGDSQAGYSLFINSENKLSAGFYNTSGKFITLKQDGGETLEKERWYHVCAVYSKSDQSLTTYIDGISDKTFSTIDAPASSAATLQIGRIQFENDSYFSGIIDELRISSVARTQNWLATAFYNESLSQQLFSTGSSETLNLSKETISANKEAFRNTSDTELKQSETENALSKEKASNQSTPVAVSTGKEVLQARLQNIKRVALENK